jgi:integrase/recombinase XerC
MDDDGVLWVQGTPPPARGRPPGDLLMLDETGNTPACAGTTTGPGPAPPGLLEHPRLRGDDSSPYLAPLSDSACNAIGCEFHTLRSVCSRSLVGRIVGERAGLGGTEACAANGFDVDRVRCEIVASNARGVVVVGTGDDVPGAARLVLHGGDVALLRPQDQVFQAMLDGWRNQQLARRLALSTVEGRERQVRAFADHAQTFPWLWSAQLMDEWMTDLRAVRGVQASTLRGYQLAIKLFCAYLTDSAYGWVGECEHRFGTHPIQVVHEWNTATHVQDVESSPAKRAFSRDELQAFFDHADDEVDRIRDAGKKGWIPAFRDAALFKTAYAYGLRRNETRMLDVTDFGTNSRAREFGEFGVTYVRHGKAMPGSPPKRRSVLTVWAWTVDVLQEWLVDIRPLTGTLGPAMWPTERAERVTLAPINHRFARYRDELGLATGLDFHSLRRSYVTHLIEDGWDPRFVQDQVGHEHASTTSIYTCVSSDFRIRTLRAVLDDTLTAAMRPDAMAVTLGREDR